MDATNTNVPFSQSKFVDFVETNQELKCIFLQRMDTLNTAKVDTVFMEKLTSLGGRKIVFDLDAVDYVASSFLRLCVIASKQSRGKLAIMNTTSTVRKVLKIAGFENLAEII